MRKNVDKRALLVYDTNNREIGKRSKERIITMTHRYSMMNMMMGMYMCMSMMMRALKL